jgi:hypothetical protein
MFIKLLIISLIFLAVAFAGLGISMLIRAHGSFPDTHISHNEEMKKRGISCAQETNVGCNPGNDNECCSTCSSGNLIRH